MITLQQAGELYTRHGSCQGCGQHCCTKLAFPITPEQMEADPSWVQLLQLHGLEVKLLSGRFAAALLTSRCSALLGNGKCGLWGSPLRPAVCSTWPHGPWDLDILTVEGQAACGYSFTENEPHG